MGPLSLGKPAPTRQRLTEEWLRNGACAISGGFAYYATGVASQLLQKAVGISAATPLVSPILGLITVATASIAAARMAHGMVMDADGSRGLGLRVLAVGLAAHVLASGNFGYSIWRPNGIRGLFQDFKVYSPSDVTQPGAFASSLASFPGDMSYASAEQRNLIHVLGRLAGCHSCGVQKGNFIADHMPPRAFAKRANEKLWRRVLKFPVTQRFHPQCVDCSKIQSVAVRARRPALVTHCTRFRRWHLVGVVVALAECEWTVTDSYVRQMLASLPAEPWR